MWSLFQKKLPRRKTCDLCGDQVSIFRYKPYYTLKVCGNFLNYKYKAANYEQPNPVIMCPSCYRKYIEFLVTCKTENRHKKIKENLSV